MPKIIPFKRLPALTIPIRRCHNISVRVIDEDYPEETRWNYQRVVQNGGSFIANKGFTDVRARRQRWHYFQVSNRLVARFARQSESFVTRGLVEVRIDGKALRMPSRRRA